MAYPETPVPKANADDGDRQRGDSLHVGTQHVGTQHGDTEYGGTEHGDTQRMALQIADRLNELRRLSAINKLDMLAYLIDLAAEQAVVDSLSRANACASVFAKACVGAGPMASSSERVRASGTE